MSFRTTSFNFEVASCILGTIFNALLLWVAGRSTKKSVVFSEFSKIVKVNVAFDVYLIVSTISSGAQIDTQGGYFFMVDGYDRRGMPPLANIMFGCLWCSSIGFAALYGALPMYFRYVTFCK
uniref:CASP-like protein n=3 Tax=Bursaphelenchus xylophilus TaxID=6326 RepID=A0A1I7RWH6_BURXY